jgi:radical SAM protein with 4Fe4S-binding SPASM domain
LEAIVDFFEHEDLVRDHMRLVTYADPNYTTFYRRFDMDSERKSLGEQIDRLRRRLNDGVKSGLEKPGSALASFASGFLKNLVRRSVGRLSPKVYPNGVCVPGAHRTFVTPDGKLYMCERVGEALPIGDLDNGYDIEGIDQALQRYIEVSASCLDCWAVRLCGACFVAALRGPELCGSAKENFCGSQRRSTLLALKQYSELVQANPDALKNAFSQVDTGSTLDLARACLEHHKQRETQESTS